MVFNPIVQSVQLDLEAGYSLQGKKFITAPYADDSTLITINKRTHHKFMDQLQEKVSSMSMKLKPSKCRTFSISSGKPTQTNFPIGDNDIPSIDVEEQKCLGRVLFCKGKSNDTFQYLKENLTETLQNIDSS